MLIPDGAAYTLGGAMRFEPDEVAIRGTHTSLGMLDDQGRFDLMTVDPKGRDGVPLGNYLVVLWGEGQSAAAEATVPDPYTHDETTPWVANVEDGRKHFVF